MTLTILYAHSSIPATAEEYAGVVVVVDVKTKLDETTDESVSSGAGQTPYYSHLFSFRQMMIATVMTRLPPSPASSPRLALMMPRFPSSQVQISIPCLLPFMCNPYNTLPDTCMKTEGDVPGCIDLKQFTVSVKMRVKILP